MSEEPSGPESRRRVSITKLQRQTAVAVELITLCQTVTEDGSLSVDEVEALRQWLDENKGVDLPAHTFLTTTVETILADGKVTAEEQRDLYKAIETVLPPDLRASVRGKRAERETGAKEEARQHREEARRAAQEARIRNMPLDTWDFMVAGVRYEGRAAIVNNYATVGDIVHVVRDRTNKFSRHAVEVRLTNGMQIGFVPEEHAVEMAPHLDDGCRHDAYIKKILAGGRYPIPVIVAALYSAQAEIPRAVAEQDVPRQMPLPGVTDPPSAPVPHTTGAAQTKSGCAGAIALVALASALIWNLHLIWP